MSVQGVNNQADMEFLCGEYLKNNHIDLGLCKQLGVKRGLRNPDGTGVLAGLTNICDVVGYEKNEAGEKIPAHGRLIYRGIDLQDLVKEAYEKDRFLFEEVSWLLLFGSLPSKEQLEHFQAVLEKHHNLPEGFVEGAIMRMPSPSIMNQMARSVLGLYSYDENPDDISLENLMQQSVTLIASLPTIMVNAYQVKRRIYDKKSTFFHIPTAGQSTAEHILSTYRADQKFTREEAKLLDLCLVVHADHGGGNNSAFACRVLSSSGTDSYSAISAAIGSLKGPRHGGANLKVMQQLDCLDKAIQNPSDDGEVAAFLRKLLRKEAGDKTGLIYGMGHAIYTLSDPRAVVLRQKAESMAWEKGMERQFQLLRQVERLAPQVFAEEKGGKVICANVDLYSGFIYHMLGISQDLFTPLFAISRIPGWCAHRIEEVVFANRIIRPAYKYLGQNETYKSLEDRI